MIKLMLCNFIDRIIKKLITLGLLDYFRRELNRSDIHRVKSEFNRLGTNFNLHNPFIIKNPKYISIGDNFYSPYNLRLEAWDEYEGQKFNPMISIGNNVVLNSDCHIGCINKVEIGDNVLMASHIYISDHSHGEISEDELTVLPIQRRLHSKGPVH